jgi:hypothetical protein
MAAAQREFAGGVRAGRRYAWYAFFGLGVAFAPALACLIGVLLGAMGGAAPGWRLAAGLGALLLVAAWIASALLARHFGGLFGAGRALIGSALGDVAANGYGLCSGHDGNAPDDPDGGEPPLTRWLYDYLQDLAGLPADAPLTFGMLKGQGIDLEMVSTCLTLARPYRLPDFSGSPGTFSWRPDDFAALFPRAVVAWMADPARSQPSAGDPAIRSLPDPDDLPVTVAVRMSLSFPVLFSAIPLWSRDFRAVPAGLPPPERLKVVASLPYEPCWFSDGGLTSNFPMQLFDDPLPSWPVFGLNLRDYHPAFPDVDVTVARTNADEYQPWFTRWEATVGATTSLTGFLGAVWNAAQNWSDNLQLTLPGFRERIAHIHLRPTEGGLNLNMPPEVIAAISDKGARAASALGDRFDPDRATAVGPAGKSEVTWDNHRWWRFRAVFASVQPFLRDLASHLRRTGRSDDLHSLLGAASDEPPHAMSYDWPSKKQRAAAIAAADRIDAVVSAWEQAKVDYETDSPRPTAGVRIAPRV